MNGIDDAMGGDDMRSMREKGEALIPRMHLFKVTVERFSSDLEAYSLQTINVVAHSQNLADGKVVFFQLRFVEPNTLVSYVTRIIGGAVLDSEDMGEVPESRIIH